MRVGPFQVQARSDHAPLTVEDWRRRARRRLPRMVWEYVENGADDESALRGNRQAFAAWSLRQRALAGIAEVDLTAKIAGEELSLPVVLAPTGLIGAVHGQGDLAAARAAERAGTRLVLSTGSSYSIEEVAQATSADHWFQLYPWGDRELTGGLLARARRSGYTALFVTVDVPVVGNRLGERRHGMGIPPVLTPGRMLSAGLRPAWSARYLRHRRVALRNLVEPGQSARMLETAQRQAVNLRPDLAWSDLAWMRDQWAGPMFVKGILDAEDAVRAAEIGADGVVVSNHGGRQLGSAPATLDALREVVAAVGDRLEVLMDGGVRCGTDVVKALALGANGVLVGRPYVYGLAGAGEAGVADVLAIFEAELRRTLHLMGVRAATDLGREHLLPAR
ncbi:alpha-hydroxy acid oxidase [Nocardioides dubius]|uniref:Alpha-hydroxy acid oxidase n=1 Tax=Nocardioides dubius TaxID=317019 RepID=A0ABN1TX37_9ACTN